MNEGGSSSQQQVGKLWQGTLKDSKELEPYHGDMVVQNVQRANEILCPATKSTVLDTKENRRKIKAG